MDWQTEKEIKRSLIDGEPPEAIAKRYGITEEKVRGYWAEALYDSFPAERV